MNTETQRKRRRHGRCIECGKPSKTWRCKACNKRKRLARQALWNKREAAGMCVDCGANRLIPGLRRCEVCLERLKRQQANYKKKHGKAKRKRTRSRRNQASPD